MSRKLEVFAETGKSFDMESNFSQLTLDIIGLAVFNYDFASLNKDSPVIQTVYTALKETETRATVGVRCLQPATPLGHVNFVRATRSATSTASLKYGLDVA